MANCKICGKPVRSANVFHPGCWETVTRRMAETFCDEYCRFPREIEDADSLQELHCDSCPLIREAADRLEQYAHEIEASVNDMKQIGRGSDSCMFCAHCCVDGEPLYRKNEPYLAFCKTCDSDNCCFEWRGVVDNSEVPKDETD